MVAPGARGEKPADAVLPMDEMLLIRLRHARPPFSGLWKLVSRRAGGFARPGSLYQLSKWPKLRYVSEALSKEPLTNMKLVVAISFLSVMPAFGQAPMDRPSAKVPKPTKADVQKVVQSISGDKIKMQTYCDLSKLNQQMAQADQKKDTKTLQTLGQKADALTQKLGPDYLKLMDGLDQVDENSSDGKEFAATFGSLAKQCK